VTKASEIACFDLDNRRNHSTQGSAGQGRIRASKSGNKPAACLVYLSKRQSCCQFSRWRHVSEFAPGAAPTDEIAAIIADHQRALLAAVPNDVASSDRHTVKPWFDNKLALSPQVLDLSDAGFPLAGG
jgi:hypothetical protein